MDNEIEEWRFGGTPHQLGAVISTLAEIRTDIVFKVSPKSDGRVRIDFTRQIDFTEPRDRITVQGWAIVQSLPSQNSMVRLFALNPHKPWLYLLPVWDAVVTELKRQGWTIEKVIPEATLLGDKTVIKQPKLGNQLYELADALEDHFDKSELKDLCFKLDVEYENLAGDTKRDKARELVLQLNRKGRIEELKRLCQQKRPNFAEKFS